MTDADKLKIFRETLLVAKEALEVLAREADRFSVSGVYFNEACMEHKGLNLAWDAIDAIEQVMAEAAGDFAKAGAA